VQAGWRPGPQGGDGAAAGPVIVSSSRAVLYPAAAPGTDFATAARAAAESTRALLQRAQAAARR
jgi:hypothetical protein